MPRPNLQQWGMDEALRLVRRMQKDVRPLGYHIALGGGVLNKGYSDKDLDLYFLPCLGERHKPASLMTMLSREWGTASKIGTSGGDSNGSELYIHKVKFESPYGRIDVFIVRNR